MKVKAMAICRARLSVPSTFRVNHLTHQMKNLSPWKGIIRRMYTQTTPMSWKRI